MSSLFHTVTSELLEDGEAAVNNSLDWTGRRLAIATSKGRVFVYDLSSNTPSCLCVLNEHSGRVGVRWGNAGQGDALLTYGADGRVVLWTSGGTGSYQISWKDHVGYSVFTACFVNRTEPGQLGFAYGGESGTISFVYNDSVQWHKKDSDVVHVTGLTTMVALEDKGETWMITGGCEGFLKLSTVTEDGECQILDTLQISRMPLMNLIPPNKNRDFAAKDTTGLIHFMRLKDGPKMEHALAVPGSSGNDSLFWIPESDVIGALNANMKIEGYEFSAIAQKWTSVKEVPLVPDVV